MLFFSPFDYYGSQFSDQTLTVCLPSAYNDNKSKYLILMITLELADKTAGSVARYYNPAYGELISGMVYGQIRCFVAKTSLKVVGVIRSSAIEPTDDVPSVLAIKFFFLLENLLHQSISK